MWPPGADPTMIHRFAAEWSEDKLRTEILIDCKSRGLIVNYHKADRLSPVRGWPDLEIVGEDVLYRELKSMTRGLTVTQRRVGSKLSNAGQNWGVWRPIDWWDGTIDHQLSRITGER